MCWLQGALLGVLLTMCSLHACLFPEGALLRLCQAPLWPSSHSLQETHLLLGQEHPTSCLPGPGQTTPCTLGGILSTLTSAPVSLRLLPFLSSLLSAYPYQTSSIKEANKMPNSPIDATSSHNFQFLSPCPCAATLFEEESTFSASSLILSIPNSTCGSLLPDPTTS